VKVLVTGAAGEFGRDLVPWLARKHDVRATDIAPAWTPCEFIQADLRDPDAAQALVDGIDAVIHLAVLLPMPHPTAAFVDVNVKASTLLCEAAAKAKVSRLVYISTVWATGHGTEEGYLPVDEDAPLRPQEMYGLTKLQGELSAEFYARMHGLSTLVLRMCGYVRCSQFAPDGSVDLSAANLGDIAACLLRPGQKVCNPNDLGRLMDAAITRDIGNFSRVIAGNAVPWQPEDIGQLSTDALPVIDRYYPGAKAMFEAYGIAPSPVGFYYSVKPCRELLGIEQEYTVADLVR
jgi:hypothetical protein